MAEWRTGSIESWRNLSPTLATFQLSPQSATRFPAYRPGQHIALRREHCRLTRRTVDSRLLGHLTRAGLRPRFQSAETVVLTCGNPSSMADGQRVAEARHLPFVKEEW